MIAVLLGSAVAVALVVSRAGAWSDVARPVRVVAARRRMRRAASTARITRSGRRVVDAPDAIDLDFWGIVGGPGERS